MRSPTAYFATAVRWCRTVRVQTQLCRTALQKYGSLVGLGVVVSLAVILIFAAASAALAGFFHEPVLRPMIIALSITFLFDALQIVPRALLQRDLQFQKLAVVNFVQVCASATVLVV